MGASISKSTSSKNHLKTFYGKSSKNASSTKIESSEYIDAQINQNMKNKNKFYTRKNKKTDVSKSIIGKPTNFIHLNHAGIDYTSMDSLFMPIEDAKLIQINTPTTANQRLSRVGVESIPKVTQSTHYNNNHNINLTTKDYTSFNEMTEIEATKSSKYGTNSLKRKPINYAALYSDELHTMTHDNATSKLSANPLLTVC